jgi:hypothetical protein
MNLSAVTLTSSRYCHLPGAAVRNGIVRDRRARPKLMAATAAAELDKWGMRDGVDDENDKTNMVWKLSSKKLDDARRIAGE